MPKNCGYVLNDLQIDAVHFGFWVGAELAVKWQPYRLWI